MDFEEIKNLIELDGGKFIIVEEGRPTLVVVSFAEYKSKIKKNIASNPMPPLTNERPAEELTIDDLPV